MEKHIKEAFNTKILQIAGNRFGVDTVYEVGGFENFIYGFNMNEKEYILRLSHSDHRTKEMIEAELDWVNYLSLHSASVAKPIYSINQQLIEVIPCSETTYFTATAYEKAKGVPPTKENMTEAFFEQYGKEIGKLHRLAKYYKPTKHKRPNWDEDLIIKEAGRFLTQDDEIILHKLHELCNEIKQLPIEEDSYGLIHGDIHLGNLFVHQNDITIFDFDDCCYMWFVDDIAIVLFYHIFLIEEEQNRLDCINRIYPFFMKGYDSEYKLDRIWLKKIPLFLKLREIILYIAINRSLNIQEDAFAKKYVSYYRNRIINDVPFIKLDFIT